MTYTIKSQEEFTNYLNNYLQTNPLDFNYIDHLINDFSSSYLSDFYKLLLDLENCELSKENYDNLKNIAYSVFGIEADKLFMSDVESSDIPCISRQNINILENIIKYKYLGYISDSSNTIDEKELYKLSLIVNKAFPEVFLSLIKTPIGNIKTQQECIKNKIMDTIDHWYSHNSKEAEEENKDIAGAIYITAKRLYPYLNIYIPSRVKSARSSISNISKESAKSLSNLIPSDYSVGLSDKDVEKQFNLKNANTDFSGITIVLDHVDDTLHFDKTDPKNAELLKLRKKMAENITFSHRLEDVLSEYDSFNFSNTDLLEIKIDLLTRLRESTYDECTSEYEGTSFRSLLKENIAKYYEEIASPHKQLKDDEVKYMNEIDEIYKLLDELKKRVYDKYQAKLLENSIPDILNEPIFSDTLKVTPKFIKNVRKKNGFCSLYYSLETIDGRKIELQVQSKQRFQDSKNGSSDHSTLPNKEVNIAHFFEPVNPDYDRKQFEYLLNILNTTPIAIKNVLNKTPDSQLSATDKRLKRKLQIAEDNIKLKDNYEIQNTLPDGTIQTSSYSLKDYLPIFAEYISPKLTSVSSHHSRFHKSVAAYSKKSLVSGFTEVLLKHDSTTCLAQKLIDKLEDLTPNDKNEVSLNGINERSTKRYHSSMSSSSDER